MALVWLLLQQLHRMRLFGYGVWVLIPSGVCVCVCVCSKLLRLSYILRVCEIFDFLRFLFLRLLFSEFVCRGHTAGVAVVAAQPTGRLLCSGGWDRTICVWNTGNYMILRKALDKYIPGICTGFTLNKFLHGLLIFSLSLNQRPARMILLSLLCAPSARKVLSPRLHARYPILLSCCCLIYLQVKI